MPYHYETEGPQLRTRIVAEHKDPAALFADGARGLWNLVIPTIALRGHDRVKIVVDSADLQSLYEEWLKEVLVRSDVEGILLNDFRVATIQKLDDGRLLLTGEAFGEAFDAEKHKLSRDPKTLKPSDAKCVEKDGVTTCTVFV